MKPLILDDCKSLFRDEDAYAEFLKILKGRVGEFSPVIADQKVLCVFMSQEAAKEILCERIVSRLTNSPGTLQEITDRLVNDRVVDGDE